MQIISVHATKGKEYKEVRRFASIVFFCFSFNYHELFFLAYKPDPLAFLPKCCLISQ